MRDVVTEFYVDVLNKLISAGSISKSDSVLVVCGGPLDELVMERIGFHNATITNLDDRMSNTFQDAENLTYEDGSFDLVVVHAGLHHCYSPHRALLEMYRVARKCVVAFESRDSILMRAAVVLGLTLDYEVNCITDDRRGGVRDTGIPNYIYRWTEREVTKSIRSFDPSRIPNIMFFYALRIPIERFKRSNNIMLRYIGLAIEPASKLFERAFPKQCNEFAFAVTKSKNMQPWAR